MYTWHISTAFGLESVVATELKVLGIRYGALGNGSVRVEGDESILAKMLLWLRCAERISLVLDQFPARDFDELFAGIGDIPWENILPQDASMQIVCPLASNAAINSARSAQSITKKAIIERMRRTYGPGRLPETGEKYQITVDLSAEQATVLLDACGDGLHRRGYRVQPGAAPVRETTAAAMVLLSGWPASGNEIFWDPCCGSGTLAIEAAMLTSDIAPGLVRYFDCENWAFLDQSVLEKERALARDRALAGIDRPGPVIRASDIDPESISIADANMKRAGVQGRIKLFKADARELADPVEPCLVLTNPPYGERLGDNEEAEKLVQALFVGMDRFRKPWRCGLLTPLREINQLAGMRYESNRKLYNGKLCVWLCWFGKAGQDQLKSE